MSRSRGSRVSAEQFEEIRQMIEKGFSITEIARIFDISVTTVREKAIKEGWHGGATVVRTPPIVERIIELLEQGLTISEMAKQLEIGITVLHDYIKRYKLQSLHASDMPLTEREKVQAYQFAVDGLPLKEIARVLNRGVLFMGQFFFEEGRMEDLPSWEEAEKKWGRLVGISKAAKDFMKSTKSYIYKAIDHGHFSDMYLTVGLDVKPGMVKAKGMSKYLFIVDKMKFFHEQYKSLKDFSNEEGCDIPLSRLERYSRRGYLDEARIHHTLFEVNKLKAMIPKISSELVDNVGKQISEQQTMDYFTLLNNDQQNWINNYIQHRSGKMPAIITGFGTVTAYKTGFSKPQKQGTKVRNELSRMFFKIICHRCDIRLQRLYGKIGAFVFSSKHDIEHFDPNVFLITDINKSDVLAIAEDISDVTMRQHIKMLKPFFSYLQMEMENIFQHKAITEKWDPIKRAVEKDHLQSIFGQLHMTMNQISVPVIEDDDYGYEKKVFLTREQFVQLFQIFFKSHGIEKALMFAVATLLGLRVEEIALVAVEDFEIDENGFLIPDENGFGKLFLPNPKTKLGRTGTRKGGNLVPPRLTRWLNRYLKTYLYPKCPFVKHEEFKGTTFVSAFEQKVYNEGHGYLFRPHPHNANSRYNRNSIPMWLKRMDKVAMLDCLPLDKRKVLSFHDGRHTLNEWIERAHVQRDLLDYRDEAADRQMRHKGKRSNDVGKLHYRQRMSFEQYYKIIAQALDFPWNVKDLMEWEVAHSYRTLNSSEKSTDIVSESNEQLFSPWNKERKTMIDPDHISQLREEVSRLDEFLKTSIHPPKDSGRDFYVERAQKLKKYKEKVEKLQQLEKYVDHPIE